MKKYSPVFILLAALPVQSAQFSHLTEGAVYRVWTDGTSGVSVAAAAGVVSVNLPAGSHKVALEAISVEPTPEPTVEPTAEPTDTPTQDPTPSATETATPSVTESPSPSATLQGQEVIVASFDEETGKNRFEVLDSAGNSLTGVVDILAGVSTEGQILTADLDGDEKLEVVAAGYNPAIGVVAEFWTGSGTQLSTVTVFPVEYSVENHLLAGNFDANPGCEVALLGRASDGTYHLASISAQGEILADNQVLDPGYQKIESLTHADVDGDGVNEVIFLARRENESVELNVVKDGAVVTAAPLFGNGYTGTASAFALDIDGDGTEEIAAVCRHSQTQDFRLLVLSGTGEVRMKRNLFPGKFETEANFTAADLDADGIDEVVAVGRMLGAGSNVVQVIDHTGTQVMARSVLDPSFHGTKSSVMADVDGDGKPELVVAGQDGVSGTAAYQVLKSDGNLLAGGTAFQTPASPALACTDLNEDGSEEILVIGEFENGAYGLESLTAQDGVVKFTTTFSSAPSYVTAGELM